MRHIMWASVSILAATAGAQVTADNAGTARNGKVGPWPSIIARGGAEAVSYFCESDTLPAPGGTHYALRFAWKDAGVWRWTNINNNAGGNDSAMARGSDGQYHIAWASWAGVRWAHGSATSWTIAPARADIGVQQPSRISIALDAQNRPHIAYMEAAPGQDRGLHYTRWDGSAWTRGAAELVATGVWNSSIGNTYLALDTSGNPALAYTQGPDTGPGVVRFARLVAGAWQSETVAPSGYDAALAIGSDNTPRLAILDDQGVLYREKVAGAWRGERIPVPGWASAIAIALADDNTPFLSVRVDNDIYACRRAGAAWAVERLEAGDPQAPNFVMAPLGSSIDVDEQGRAHVAYASMFILNDSGGFREDLRVATSPVNGTPCTPVTASPSDAATCPHGSADFAAGAEPGSSFAWEFSADGVAFTPLADGLNPFPGAESVFTAAGVHTDRLTLSAPDQDHGRLETLSVRCVVTAACGSAASDTARLAVCPADINCDGFLDFFDDDEFVAAFEAGDDRGDFNGDGFIDFFDYDAFITAFETGC